MFVAHVEPLFVEYSTVVVRQGPQGRLKYIPNNPVVFIGPALDIVGVQHTTVGVDAVEALPVQVAS